MAERLQELRKAFKPFAAISVFLGLKSDAPLEFRAISDSVSRSTGYQMSVEDLAVLRGLLGTHVVDLSWDLDNRDRLLYSINASLIKSKSTKSEPSAKRQRTCEALDPVKLITDLVDTFNDAAGQLPVDDLAGALARLARENMPPSLLDPVGLDAASQPQTVEQFLEDLQTNPAFHGHIVDEATCHYDAASAQYQATEHAVDAAIWAALDEQRHISRLYAHQAQAIDHVLDGHSVVVSTRTASGKSLIYQIPILQMLLRDPQAKFLLVFPTKALAQDQAQSLRGIIEHIPALHSTTVSTLDGDERETDARRHIRETSSIILTNPDTLHASMLPGHQQWHAFWTQLRLVILDELHVYQGQFGQHVSHIFARMQRLASPQFVACSATTSNPREHMQMLCHTRAEVVSQDGAPHGRQSMVLWDSGTAAERPSDVIRIAARLLQNSLRAIVFCKHRQACELVFRELCDYLDAHSLAQLKPRVMSYRGGYTAAERRQIEHQLFSDQLHVVIATSALELGIDVGSLDVVVMLGTPLSSSSLWQQAGRAGRQPQQASMALVIATQSPLDRQTVRTPHTLFERTFAPAQVSSEPAIAAAHLQCAAFELPISPAHDTDFAQKLHTNLQQPDSVPLPWDPATQKWCCSMQFKPWPPLKVPIRSIRSADWQVVLLPTTSSPAQLVEEMDEWRALFTLYEGGILLHRGHTYSIDDVDGDRHIALVSRSDVSWFTRQRDYVDVIPSHAQRAAPVGASTLKLNYGPVEIATTVFGYKRIDTQTRRVLEYVERRSPRLVTTSWGVWIDVPLSAAQHVTEDMEASIHAAQHAMWAEVCAQTACLPGELGTECKSPLATRSKRPCLIIFETAPVSSGPTLRALPHARTIMQKVLARVRDCSCSADGCTKCVLMSACPEHNQCISKTGAMQLLQNLFEG
ncbi:ATP-dependent 3'-5' DNA helicase [Coemansia erecta]|nr:ATP-dependent 3'-5' DNA helicase [Coemansia erecta]